MVATKLAQTLLFVIFGLTILLAQSSSAMPVYCKQGKCSGGIGAHPEVVESKVYCKNGKCSGGIGAPFT